MNRAGTIITMDGVDIRMAGSDLLLVRQEDKRVVNFDIGGFPGRIKMKVANLAVGIQ